MSSKLYRQVLSTKCIDKKCLAKCIDKSYLPKCIEKSCLPKSIDKSCLPKCIDKKCLPQLVYNRERTRGSSCINNAQICPEFHCTQFSMTEEKCVPWCSTWIFFVKYF